MNETLSNLIVRNTLPQDFAGISEMPREVYAASMP